MAQTSEFMTVSVTGHEFYSEDNVRLIVQEELGAALRETLRYGRVTLRDEIERSGAVATRTLLNSTASRLIGASVGAWLTQGEIYFTGPAANYAKGADEGSKPTSSGLMALSLSEQKQLLNSPIPEVWFL